MRIHRIRAHRFGKLNGSLDLAPGMTVVHGGNEAGKSTWLQAIFAGLCGRRRGRGANTLEDREFERQYEPWNGEAWRATIKFQLDDGRRIEIQQTDLKTKESAAHDAETGRQLGDEIIYRGSIDGSRFLGLNRQVVPSTLVIAQGDIQRLRRKSEKKGDEASALKEELQRAAASAGGAATAAEALRLLKSYAAAEVGTERRNSTRPLQRAIDRAAVADKALDDGRAHHRERSRLESGLRAARDRSRKARRRMRRIERRLTERELERLDRRLAEIVRLEALLPDGGAPAELEGPGAAEMARELAEMPESARGDREVAPEVAEAASRWRRASDGRAMCEQLGPGDPPPTPIDRAGEPVARRALAALEQPPLDSPDELERRVEELQEEQALPRRELEAHSGFGRWPWLGATAGSLLGIAAMLDLLPRLVGLGGVLLAVACSLLIQRAQKRSGPPPASHEQAETGMALADARADLRDLKRRRRRRQRSLETAARDLESLGLEADADAVRNALDALGMRARWDRDHANWERRMASTRRDEAAAEKDLRAALHGRGAEDPEAPAGALLDRYERECRRNRALAAGTDRRALTARLDARRQELEARREALAARLDAQPDDATDTAASDEARQLREASDDDLERELAQARDDAAGADNEASNHRGRLDADADLPSLAELEEEQAAADGEVALLRRAAVVLETAREHLEAAQDEVHRILAPDLRQGLEERLSRVSGGRYAKVRVDPEQGLEVQIEVEDGAYRSASELSYGTVDQVYLLLRIALAEALGDRKESAPLFLDDATVHCDADRTTRFLDLLLALSEERQIVVFSQEEEVRGWAERRLGGNARHRLVELDGEGRPRGANGGVEADTADSADSEASQTPDPERQHSLL